MRSIQAIKGVFRVNTIEDILKTQSFNINKGKVEGSSRKKISFCLILITKESIMLKKIVSTNIISYSL